MTPQPSPMSRPTIEALLAQEVTLNWSDPLRIAMRDARERLEWMDRQLAALLAQVDADCGGYAAHLHKLGGLDEAGRVKYLNALRKIVSARSPKNKAGVPLVSDFDLLAAPMRERVEALGSI